MMGHYQRALARMRELDNLGWLADEIEKMLDEPDQDRVRSADRIVQAYLANQPAADEQAVVRPGEVLVLRYNRVLNQREADMIRERLRGNFPDIDVIIAEADAMEVRARELVHLCPPPGEVYMPCCDRLPFELRDARMTLDPDQVTCDRGGV